MSYLARLRLTVAQLGSKVLAVAPEDTVGHLHAHQRTGLAHHHMGGARLVLVIQVVVDLPLVGPHYIPNLFAFHHSFFAEDGHHAVDSSTWNLSYRRTIMRVQEKVNDIKSLCFFCRIQIF